MVLLVTYGMRLGSALEFLLFYQSQITLLLLAQAALVEFTYALTATATRLTYLDLWRFSVAIVYARILTLMAR